MRLAATERLHVIAFRFHFCSSLTSKIHQSVAGLLHTPHGEQFHGQSKISSFRRQPSIGCHDRDTSGLDHGEMQRIERSECSLELPQPRLSQTIVASLHGQDLIVAIFEVCLELCQHPRRTFAGQRLLPDLSGNRGGKFDQGEVTNCGRDEISNRAFRDKT